MSSVEHMYATADNDGFLMPSYVGTDYEEQGRKAGCVEDGSAELFGRPVSWPRLTERGRYFRDYYRRVGVPDAR